MDYFAKEYYDWKDDIVIAESQILKVSQLRRQRLSLYGRIIHWMANLISCFCAQRLGFNTVVQNPYGSIVNYLQVLSLTDHPEITQRAWSFANDLWVSAFLCASLGKTGRLTN